MVAALPQKDLIHETSTTVGTTAFTTVAVNGKVRFGDSTYGFGTTAVSDQFDYYISNRDAAEWERGTGHASALGTLVRDTIIASSNANSVVSFSAGTKDCTNDVPAALQLRANNNLSDLSDTTGDTARQNIKVAGFNYLVNPTGLVQQVPVGTQADVTYDFDQWLTLTQSNAITASQVTAAENGTPSMMRSLQANASAQRFGRVQWLENGNCSDLRGQSVTLFARVRMSASTTLRYAIVEWTGTADVITKDLVLDWTNGTFTAGNFFTTTSTTVVATGSIALAANTLTDIAALTGAVSGSMNNLAAFFWTDSTQAQNVTLDIAKVKLEKGTKTTPFVMAPFVQILSDCQRWFEKSYDYSVAPGTASAGAGRSRQRVDINDGAAVVQVLFKKTKRVTPTMTYYSTVSGSSGVGRDDVAGGDATCISESPTGCESFVWNMNVTAGKVNLGVQWTANARL